MSLARILGKTRGLQSYVSDARWVLPTSFIGLEHEYEGVKDSTLPRHTFADFWAWHEEGSLKDNGAEYVFATPMFGVDAYNALEWLVSHAKASGWKCTKRTGIHVHLDVRDLTVPQLAGLCILYAAVEPILYHWVGDGRDSSHFCIPLYRADEALSDACSIIRSAFQDEKEDGHSALGLAGEYQRYAGFNLQALHKFGSIEFRQLQTTHDLVRITDWINMVMSFKAAAMKLPQSDGAVVRMIQRMGARELLYYVFPSAIAEKLYTIKSEEEFRTRGLPSARDIAVHGCGTATWVKKDFPRGEHAGFVKWMKGAKEVKSSDSDEFAPIVAAERMLVIDDEGEEIDFDEPEERPVVARNPHRFEFNPPLAAGVPPWGLADAGIPEGLRGLERAGLVAQGLGQAEVRPVVWPPDPIPAPPQVAPAPRAQVAPAPGVPAAINRRLRDMERERNIVRGRAPNRPR